MAARPEQQTDTGGEAAKKKPGGGLKKIAIIALVLIVVAAASLVAGRVMMKRGTSKGRSAAHRIEVGATMPLDEFLVNLADDGHYMKVTIALGLKQGVSPDKLTDSVAPIRDAIVSVLSSQHLKSLDTDAGKQHLKQLLIAGINGTVPDNPVVAVYFTAFTTQ